MTYAQATYLLPFVACAVAMVIGLSAIFAPDRSARFWGMPSHPAFMRVYLGGAALFSSAFCLYWQAPSAFWSVGAGWLGLGITRLAADSGNARWRAVGIEFALAASMLVGLLTN